MGFFEKVAEKLAEILAKVAKPIAELSLWIGLIKEVREDVAKEVEAEGGTGADKLKKSVDRIVEILSEAIENLPQWIVTGGKLLICLINAAVYALNLKNELDDHK